MEIGTTVLFKGEEYKVIWVYSSDTCEIKRNDYTGEVELVSLAEINVVQPAH